MSNIIHPTSFIDKNVIIGDNNYIGPFCYITGDTIIGNNNRFEAYCSIGTAAEHRDYFTSDRGKTIIGNDNIIREFVTIHAGTKNTTKIEDNVIVLNHSHIAHDVYIESKSIISASVTLAGHCYVMEGANIALGSICHQFQIIGAYSMLGMGSIVTKTTKIEPGNIYVGSPARFLKVNKVGLERSNIDEKMLDDFMKKYNKLINEIQ